MDTARANRHHRSEIGAHLTEMRITGTERQRTRLPRWPPRPRRRPIRPPTGRAHEDGAGTISRAKSRSKSLPGRGRRIEAFRSVWTTADVLGHGFQATLTGLVTVYGRWWTFLDTARGRSGVAVYERGVHRPGPDGGRAVLDGRLRAVPGQRFHRAAVAVAEVRSGVSSRTGRRVCGRAGDRGADDVSTTTYVRTRRSEDPHRPKPTARSARREYAGSGAWNRHGGRLQRGRVAGGEVRTAAALCVAERDPGRELPARRRGRAGTPRPRHRRGA